jgi:hypothetical protein
MGTSTERIAIEKGEVFLNDSDGSTRENHKSTISGHNDHATADNPNKTGIHNGKLFYDVRNLNRDVEPPEQPDYERRPPTIIYITVQPPMDSQLQTNEKSEEGSHNGGQNLQPGNLHDDEMPNSAPGQSTGQNCNAFENTTVTTKPVNHPTHLTTTSHNNDLDDEHIGLPQSNEQPLCAPKPDRGIRPSTKIRPWPSRLKPWMGYITKAIEWTPPAPFNATDFRFETSMEAAEHNFRVLERQKFDLQEIITGSESENTPIRPGSEFRPIHLLDRILQNHPLWPRARRTLTRGFTMPMVDIPEENRKRDVSDALTYGNHKSTLLNPAVVLEMLDEEVKHGWQLVLPSRSITGIPGTIISPLGLVQQNTINELGETTVKWRLTHDQSFKFSSETSVNSRVLKDQLAQCMYGSALKRFIHAIVRYRLRFPDTPLLMAKFDLKSAYRRAHFSGSSALQSIATNHGLCANQGEDLSNGLAYVSLRFTFGGSSNPSEFSVISEMIADLANTIIQHKDWDPKTLHSEFITLTGERPIMAENGTAFAAARELLIEWEMSDFGMTDAYIDDIFTVFPFISEEHFHRG